MKSKIWLSSPHIGKNELNYVNEAFETNWIAPLGPHVNAFEEGLQEQTQTKHAAALSSGTSAIHLALILLGVKADDIVFCQSITFSASANPISYQGAIPVFIDSENDNSLTPEQKEIRIEQLKQHFFRLLGGWNLTMKGNTIESIKLSVIVDFIKHIVGPSCKINLLDYSCNGISMFVPKNQLPNKQYMIENDIEQGYSKNWGGKQSSKKNRKKYKKKSKTQRHNKNQKTRK